jgi:hypothetical protein
MYLDALDTADPGCSRLGPLRNTTYLPTYLTLFVAFAVL